MLDDIDLNKKALFTRVTSAHVATYYYTAFSYLMLGAYYSLNSSRAQN